MQTIYFLHNIIINHISIIIFTGAVRGPGGDRSDRLSTERFTRQKTGQGINILYRERLI